MVRMRQRSVPPGTLSSRLGMKIRSISMSSLVTLASSIPVTITLYTPGSGDLDAKANDIAFP